LHNSGVFSCHAAPQATREKKRRWTRPPGGPFPRACFWCVVCLFLACLLPVPRLFVYLQRCLLRG
jgi:hypothetical protein